MTILHVDFETRSTVDLKKAGLDVYAKHRDTDVWCMAFALDDGPVELQTPTEPLLDDIGLDPFFFDFVRTGGTVVAHNAAFELAIWNSIMVPRYGWPELKPEQVVCTMAMAYAMALPGSLENAAAAVGLDVRKDMAGRRVMMQLSRPKEIEVCPDCVNGVQPKGGHEGTTRWFCLTCGGDWQRPVWHDDPAKLEKLYAYCKQDVEVERQLHKRLLELSAAERKVWQLDYAINQRGVQIDIPAVRKAIEIVEAEQARLNEQMRKVTNNAVATCQAVSQLGDWIRWQGVDMPGVAKADVIDALRVDDTPLAPWNNELKEPRKPLPPVVRQALLLRQEAAKSSTAKLTAMVEATSADGRLRNMHQYHGASTGRWAGRRVQVHNLPRYRAGIKPGDVERMIDMLSTGRRDQLDFEYGPVLNAVSDCLRGFIVAAPGHDLIASDFANIEGRVLAWLAGEAWKLDAFRAQDAGGLDLYITTYAKSFGLDPRSIKKSDPRRQVGKVEELAFGFGGGKGAWRTMEKTYQPPAMTDDQVEDIKNRWREQHPATVRFWRDLEDAAVTAVLNPGQVFSAGKHIRYKVKGSFLFCQLPSGRLLSYPVPRVVEITTPWGELKDALTFKTELIGEARKKAKIVDDPSNGGNWFRISTYGGSLSENVTQAVARDLLAEAMVRVENAGYPVVMHVHDELVVEVEQGLFEPQKRVEEIMAEVPAWAAGLPVATEGWTARRYRK